MLPTDSTRVHCVDPETFAAWVEGGLGAPEAAQVEAHLATCARCQAMLATFATIDDDTALVPATAIPFWSRRPVQWTAAALAAAASVAMWTMTRPVPPAAVPAPPAAVQMAEASRGAEPAAPSPAALPAPATPQTSARRVGPPPTSPPVVAEPPPPPPVPAQPAPVGVPVPPPVIVSATPPVIPATTAVLPMARQESLVYAVPGGVVSPRVVFEVVSASEQNVPAVAGRVGARAGRGGGGRGGAVGGAAALTDLGARRAAVRWRVTAASGVERSLNDGQTWEPATLDPPFVLTAGSAPFQNVCWLVGQDGAVFRSTNGTSFERMTAPDKVHLVLVAATDDLRAMVTTVDGRIFETSDGGVSWTLK